MPWVPTSSFHHTPLLLGYERSHREAAIRSPSVIFSLTLIHPLHKANKSGSFLGTRYQALLILSVPQSYARAVLHPARGGPALQATLHMAPHPRRLEHLRSSHPCPDTSVSGSGDARPARVSPANAGARAQPPRQLFYSNSSGFLTFCPGKQCRQTASGDR